MSAVRRFSSIVATTSYDAATLHGRSIIGSNESLIGSNFLQPYQQPTRTMGERNYLSLQLQVKKSLKDVPLDYQVTIAGYSVERKN